MSNVLVKRLFDSNDDYTGYGNDPRTGGIPSSITAWASRIHDFMYMFLDEQTKKKSRKYLPFGAQAADAWHTAAVGDDMLGTIARTAWHFKHGFYAIRDDKFERRFIRWANHNGYNYIFSLGNEPKMFALGSILQSVFGARPRPVPVDGDFEGVYNPPLKRLRPMPGPVLGPFTPEPTDPWPPSTPAPVLPPNNPYPEPESPTGNAPKPPVAWPTPIRDIVGQYHDGQFGHKGRVKFSILKL